MLYAQQASRVIMTYQASIAHSGRWTSEETEAFSNAFQVLGITCEFQESESVRGLTVEQAVIAYVVSLPLTQLVTGFMREHGRGAATELRRAFGSVLGGRAVRRRLVLSARDQYILLRNSDDVVHLFVIPATNLPIRAWQSIVESASSTGVTVQEVGILLWDDELNEWKEWTHGVRS